jgi:hypothetical protein
MLAFCQVLAAEGETILYVSRHGPFEKGKDIITRDPAGEIRAYQLKAADIGLGEWRQIYGEIVNLVELAVELPGTPPIKDFAPYVVTNGELTDPVLENIRVANVSWQGRGFNKPLRVIQKPELVDRFRAAHGSYLPHQLSDFRSFLELVLREGSAPADKERAARLIEHVLPSEPEHRSALDLGRAAASLVLLIAYITGPATLGSNHWSVFEYWVVAAAYILYLDEKSNNKARPAFKISFDVCEMAADAALDGLAKECSERADLVQGFPLIDGHAYRARVTLLVGLLSARDLSLRIRGKPRADGEFVWAFLDAHLKQAQMWGESAVPYLFLAALEAEQNCEPHVAEALAIQMVREVSAANGAAATGRGICNLYYSAEEALRVNYGLDFLNPEQFVGFTYTAASLIDFLARRWRRQALAAMWFGMTRMSLAVYVPASLPEWFRWKSSEGTLTTTLPGEPQSWEALRTQAEAEAISGVPRGLVERPAFALWFVIVYPHRFTPALAWLIEKAVWKSVGVTEVGRVAPA